VAWLKIESSVSRNKKFVKAGPAPSWLWVCGLAYCQEGLTDGFIPAEALPYLGVKNAAHLASHLVKAGLWDVADGGWYVHDYLEHNKPAAEISRIRLERKVAGAHGGKASGEARRNHVASQVSKQPANPSTATATATATEAATATASVPASGTARPPSIIRPPRKDAAYEHEGGLYVPMRAHQDLLPMHAGKEHELFDWYPAVCVSWTGRQTGADMIKFWKARHDETWPPERAAVAPTRAEPAWVTRARALKAEQVRAQS
jgi:hypothetical protein